MQTRALEPDTACPPPSAFLSFATEDKPLVDALRIRLRQQHPGLELLDHAVKDGYEEDWRRECARKIDRATLLICLVGLTTHRSQAVAWEVDHGLSLGKHVVAVNLTAHVVTVPEVLARNAIEPQHSATKIILPPPAQPTSGGEVYGRPA